MPQYLGDIKDRISILYYFMNSLARLLSISVAIKYDQHIVGRAGELENEMK